MNTVKESYLQLWEQQAHELAWFKEFTQVLEWNLPYAHWFVGGELNASYLCLDRHIIKGHGNHCALVWQSENGDKRSLTYQELYDEVNRFAYVLKTHGVKKGDNVVIYMPMIPEALIAMLACTRLGATHSVVFSGFSSLALQERITDLQARFIITADYGLRRGKKIATYNAVKQAADNLPFIQHVLVIQRGSDNVPLKFGRDIVYASVCPPGPVYVAPVAVESNHPLFILYTSGTTGKPKGIVHSTGGYLVYCYSTFKWAFNPDKNSLYWCTADVGWITGHSYVTYAPLIHGITTFIFEGAPDYPDPGIWWKLIQENHISLLYTSPTALRMAIAAGDSWPQKYDLSSLQLLGSVGEPINPEVFKWYSSTIGNSRCPVVDTWWQTETGGFMIAPSSKTPFQLHFPSVKPGSATKPLPGIDPQVVTEEGISTPANTKGYLIITHPWPGMTIGIHNDAERFKEIYWSKFPGAYYTGDYAIMDNDGYFWLLGRADEVVNIAGHRIGTAEIESAAINHPGVAEAAAIGIHDDIRGEAIVLFVTLKQTFKPTLEVHKEISALIRNHIGPFVIPKEIYCVGTLPKTRSGKILRRVLKGIVDKKTLGDITTLEDEASLEEIKSHYNQLKNELTMIQNQ